MNLHKLEDCQEETSDLVTALARVTAALLRAKARGSWSDFEADLADAVLSLKRVAKDAAALQRRARGLR